MPPSKRSTGSPDLLFLFPECEHLHLAVADDQEQDQQQQDKDRNQHFGKWPVERRIYKKDSTEKNGYIDKTGEPRQYTQNEQDPSQQMCEGDIIAHEHRREGTEGHPVRDE